MSDTQLPVFKIVRDFDAPKALVWRCWTQPDLLARWTGPKGCQADILKMDFRPGGELRTKMEFGEGKPIYGKNVYQEINAPEHLSWHHSFCDAEGKLVRHPMQPVWPLILMTHVTLEDLGGKTRLTLTWEPHACTPEEIAVFAEAMDSMTQGWGGSFERLDEELPDIMAAADPATLVIERVFKAPQSLVWKCWTQPDLLARWYGPNVESIIHKFDMKEGGEWLHEMRMESGSQYSKAVFEKVQPENLLEWLHSSTDKDWNIGSVMMPDWPATLRTMAVFKADGDLTKLTFTWTPHEASEAEMEMFASMKDRMGGGWGMGFAKIDELLLELQG